MSSGDYDQPVLAMDTEAFSPIADEAEVLYRQIHPIHFQGGDISSAAFRPTKDDMGCMSVDRSSLTSAEASFELYRENGRESDAVYGLTVGEFRAEQIHCYPDPLDATATMKANKAHAYADYNGLGTSKLKTKSQRLRTVSLNRGRLHPPG